MPEKNNGKKRVTTISICVVLTTIGLLMAFAYFFLWGRSKIQTTRTFDKAMENSKGISSPSNTETMSLQAGSRKKKDFPQIDHGSERAKEGEKSLMIESGDPKNSLQIEALIKDIVSKDWKRRGKAAESLIQIGIPAVDPLRGLLQSENIPLVALPDVIKTLGQIADPRAVPELNRMSSHNNAYVRRCTTAALGSISDPESIPVLLKLLEDSDIDVRSLAIQGLARIARRGNSEVVEKISHILYSPREHELVRSSAISALGKIGDETAVSPLSSILRGRYDLSLKDLSVISLGEIGDPAAIGSLIEHRDKLLSNEPADKTFRKICEKSLQLTNESIDKISGDKG